MTVREGKIRTMCGERNGDKADVEGAGLYEELVRYSAGDFYPCHMPGHKRSREAGAMARYYGIDITEIDGFDNLHHAEGVLREAQQRANRLYGNEDTETFYLINGSTCGVLASVMTAAGQGEEILIARNCHKSVYHAAILQNLRLRYCYPPVLEECGICGGIRAEEIDDLLRRYPDCRAVVITSPTYEGILSDVSAVADAVHTHGKILIVDEAHGAHLGLHESVPPGAIAGGADLVIHSLHKTLPAMTQTALLHVQGERVDREKLQRYLRMLQSSSPSYVLMASMDSCIRYMEAHGAERYAFMRRQYDRFCQEMRKCRYIRVGGMEKQDFAMADWDVGKLVIYVRNGVLNGQQLYEWLRDDYHLQMEMAAETYVLAIMTIMDTEEGWQRLADALRRIDDRIETGYCGNKKAGIETVCGLREGAPGQKNAGRAAAENVTAGMTAAGAFFGEREEIPLKESVGSVAADFINLYPPGIPLAAPGEVIGDGLPAQVERSIAIGLRVQGVSSDGKVAVVAGNI